MRSLTLDESIEKVYSNASEVEFSDKKFFLKKLNLFWNFLESQPRLKNVLEIIERDFATTFSDFPDLKSNYTAYYKKAEKLFDQQTTNQNLGAYSYYFIRSIKDDENWSTPFEVTLRVFHGGTNYEDLKDRFIEIIFKPFISLLIEILEESKTDNLDDYFSKKEIKETEDRIDEIIEKLAYLSMGQEIIYDELQDLKEQLNVLSKKNWIQLLKGKLIDLSVIKVAEESIKLIYKGITGEDILFLQ